MSVGRVEEIKPGRSRNGLARSDEQEKSIRQAQPGPQVMPSLGKVPWHDVVLWPQGPWQGHSIMGKAGPCSCFWKCWDAPLPPPPQNEGLDPSTAGSRGRAGGWLGSSPSPDDQSPRASRSPGWTLTSSGPGDIRAISGVSPSAAETPRPVALNAEPVT